MKLKLIPLMLLGAATAVSSAHAERLQVEITGDVTSMNPIAANLGPQITTARAVIIYDDAVSYVVDPSNDAHVYEGAVESIHYEFFDMNGAPVTIASTTDFDFASTYDVVKNDYTVNTFDPQGQDVAAFAVRLYRDEMSEVRERMRVAFLPADPMLDFLDPNYPNPRFNTNPGALLVRLITKTPNEDIARFRLDNPMVTYSLPDADEDGVPDASDQCAGSMAGTSVMINGVDTGVSDAANTDGCTIADQLAACEAEQAGGFPLAYSGPTICERGVLYDAYRNELITYPELRQLRQLL
ncbi:hypothetical protein [Pseudidiomarina sediminum]|uniref:hypothetical protein n=1 Tax=Pseudidiomarina sediminum TaxID=431675 RepID=UPI001C960D25|nr:hypothetical protein [Pseudidiomarina sediminum]MBY6063660.1 hypothetical protein [Pseudidiomarina sediminum]